MPSTTLKVRRVHTVFSGRIADQVILKDLNGSGACFTYVASGAAGETATVQGSVDGVVWIDVLTLTVTDKPDVATVQHVYRWLRFGGNAHLGIARGAA